MENYILVINSGSATLKFKIFQAKDFSAVLSGIVEKIGLKGSFINVKIGKKEIFKKFKQDVKNHEQAIKIVFAEIDSYKSQIKVIGHRVVHGGQDFTRPTAITKKVLVGLEKYNHLAPLHNPVNLACIKACLKELPKIKNVAIFDTAFYKTLPDFAYLYSIPSQYYKKFGIRRYGFHGISHEYVALEAAKKVKKPLNKLKLITCHLGSGCSITAIKNGKAVETSMGFTPLEGLTMGTRSGDLDPDIPLYLQKKLKIGPEEIEEILNKKSGILGISGFTSDMRDIMLASGYKIPGYKSPRKFSQQDKTRGKLALEIFIYDIVRYIGSYAMIMAGVDYIVFTAGIGERNAQVRNLIMRDVKKFLTKVKLIVIPTNEELMIVRQVSKSR